MPEMECPGLVVVAAAPAYTTTTTVTAAPVDQAANGIRSMVLAVVVVANVLDRLLAELAVSMVAVVAVVAALLELRGSSSSHTPLVAVERLSMLAGRMRPTPRTAWGAWRWELVGPAKPILPTRCP